MGCDLAGIDVHRGNIWVGGEPVGLKAVFPVGIIGCIQIQLGRRDGLAACHVSDGGLVCQSAVCGIMKQRAHRRTTVFQGPPEGAVAAGVGAGGYRRTRCGAAAGGVHRMRAVVIVLEDIAAIMEIDIPFNIGGYIADLINVAHSPEGNAAGGGIVTQAIIHHVKGADGVVTVFDVIDPPKLPQTVRLCGGFAL